MFWGFVVNSLILSLTRLSRPAKRGLQIITDACLIVASLVAAMALRLESFAFVGDARLWLAMAPVVALTLAFLYGFGLYRAIIRFISGQLLTVVLLGAVVSAVALYAFAALFSAQLPRSVPGIYAVLMFLSVGGVRFAMQKIFRKPAMAHRLAVVVYGAGEAGRQVAKALDQGREYQPIAFLDDDPTLHNTVVAGKRVYSPQRAALVTREYRARTVLLAMPKITRARRREIVGALEPLGVEVKTMPGMADIVTGRAKFSDLLDISPEDLLGRDPVPPRDDLMGGNITGKVVLVSGAGGSIGSELCRQIVERQPAVLVLFELCEYALYAIHTELREKLERAETPVRLVPALGSVQNAGRVRHVLAAHGVQTVYHAAAYKHVSLVEDNVVEGVRNNVFGTRVMAEAAAAAGVESFIMVSTDKAVRPTNLMGATKRMAEMICQAMAQEGGTRTTFSMVRFGNVLGSSGSVIPRFRAQIVAGGPVTVTHRDVTRFFMTIPEAAQLVIQAGAMARGGDVFLLHMGEPVRILDLARTMIRLHGLKPYLLDEAEPEKAGGDIAIRITGLGKGEKLYEELLIGGDAQATEHPRIMSATEICPGRDELQRYLDRLARACAAEDVPAVLQVFAEAPVAYRPTGGEEVRALTSNAA